MQSEKLKRNKLENYPDPEKEKQILKTKKTTKTQTKTSTKLKTKLNNKEKAANVENEDIDVEKDDALIEMTRGEPDYSLLGARPKTKGNLVATKGKEFEMIDHEKTRANGSEAAEKREKFQKISKFFGSSTTDRPNLGKNGQKIVRKSSQEVVDPTRTPLPSEALPLTSINGTMKTIAGKDTVPESNNAVSEAEISAITTPVRRGIRIGQVAALKDKFDGLSEVESKDLGLKRLQRGCLKPNTPGSAKKRGNLSRKSKKNSTYFDKNQTSILNFCRRGGAGGGS